MRVADIMTAPAVTIASTSSLADAVRIMVLHRLSALPVLDESAVLCGVISEGDLLHRSEIGTTKRSRGRLSDWFSPVDTAISYRKENGRRVAEIMSTPAFTIDDNAGLSAAADMLQERGIKFLPVTHGDTLVGIINRFDLMRALQMFLAPAYEEQATSDEEIRNRILTEVGQHRWADYCDLDVLVDNGHVVLRGVAGNDDQRRSLCVAAENVIGVQGVISEIVLLQSAGISGL